MNGEHIITRIVLPSDDTISITPLGRIQIPPNKGDKVTISSGSYFDGKYKMIGIREGKWILKPIKKKAKA